MNSITQWLTQKGLGHYAVLFEENAIDEEVLRELTEPDLEKIGIKLGDRKRLLRAIAGLPAEPSRAALLFRPPSDPGTVSSPERRQLTVMFCDLVGSTALSQRLDPEDLRDITYAYQQVCTARIERYEGYVARFMGDGVLAYFGYPQAHEDDPERAVRAALDLVAATAALDKTLGREKHVELAVRVGIATGPVVVGDIIGDGESLEHGVIGETPNLAARLQGFAVPNSILVTARTRRLSGQHIQYRSIGEIALKGIGEPVQAWQVVDAKDTESRFDAVRETALAPIVGREDEIFLLQKRWARAQAGDGQVVMLCGEAGIGKSRLVQVMRERAAEDAHALLRFQCSPHHTSSALHPIVSYLERAADFSDEDSGEEKFNKLSAALGGPGATPEDLRLIADLLSIGPGDTRARLDPATLKEQTLAALLRRFEALITRPVLCIFEDLHWIDPSTMELLDRLVERAQTLPVLLLITFRTGFDAPWIGHPHVTYLSISRMNRRNTVEIAEGITGGKALPAEVIEQIVQKTDGVPLFVEELTKTVLESGVLVDGGDHYETSGALQALDIPVTLQDSLMARLDRLGTSKEIAQIGAAIGRDFSYALVSAVAAWDETALSQALDALVQSELLFRHGAPPHASYTFKHALVQEAAYGSLLRRRRQSYHTRIAQCLERRFPDEVEQQPELLAHHYTRALAPEKALAYWRKAGRRAAQRSAHLESIDHVSRGLQIIKQLPDTRESRAIELDLQMLLGAAVRATRGYAAEEVELAFRRARELCQEIGDASRLFEAVWGLWLHHLVRADLDTAYGLAEQAFELASREGDAVLLAEAYIATGVTRFQRGELVAGCEQLESCFALYEPEKHGAQVHLYGQDPGVFSLAYLAWGSWFFGYPQRAVAQIEQAVRMARDIRHPYSLMLALTFAGRIHYCRRDAQAVATLVEETIAVCSEHHFPYYLAQANIQRGWAWTRMGHEAKGIAEMRRGMSGLSATGTELGRAGAFVQLAEAYEAAGFAEDALGVLNEASDSTHRHGSRYWDAEIARLRGVITLSLEPSRSEDARKCFREAIEIARGQRIRSFELRSAMDLARLWQAEDNDKAAFDLISDIYNWFTEGFDTADLQAAKTLLNELA